MSIRAGSPRQAWFGDDCSTIFNKAMAVARPFGEPVIGTVDARHPRGRQCNAFGRQTLGDDEVGMAFAHEATIGFVDCAGRCVGSNAEDRVGDFVAVVLSTDVMRRMRAYSPAVKPKCRATSRR